MNETIILRENPKIEFQLKENGFHVQDEKTKQHNGFYSYADLKAIEVNKAWFPLMAKYLRAITWIANGGVPYFPDAESYKKANLILHFNESKLGIWLTDMQMTKAAKRIKILLEQQHKTFL